MVPSPRPRASYSLTGVTPASTVLVYRNGDPFYSGRKFVIHHRHVRTFEALIAQLNEGVEVPFGVRTLYTPQEGHRIRNLSEIKQGGKYVAAGRERFKKLDYIHISIKKPQRRKKVVVIKPVVHSKIRVPSRWQLISNKPRNIKFTLKNWNCVLALINEKIFPRSGGVHRLYTLDGHAVRNSDGLEDNHYYVAAGKEKFKSLPYWRSSRVSPEVQRRYGESPKRPRKKKARSEKHSASQPSCRHSAKSPKSPKPADGKAHSVFYAKESKEVKKARPERTTPLGSDKAPSIFKAGKPRGEVQGAAEVQEDKNLKVEMPIDQVPAQIVQEEEIVAPASTLADETEEGGSPYEDIENKEKKKEWSFRNMFGFFLKKPGESKDKKGESEQNQPAEEPLPEQINEKKGT
ncbi:doublecortin domain-containing protein 2C isoform X3 [Gopherus flavomarginatus]|uniref:doublecortin domain-containing protein 2C isoform X3 n=1 Tax=Gopherus flavomarginatus TaxID=286002 RepID=UPI0021CC1C0B|nr:doublecortin domain-containing protein 2C isoform X3 [Gopherus flavomarginatus]